MPRFPRRHVTRHYAVLRTCRTCKEQRFIAEFRSLADAKAFVKLRAARGHRFKIESQ